jgi:ATP-dependent Zn protease
MGQFPTQPLNYMGSPPAQPPPARRRGSLFGWVLFIGLAIMLFMLLSKNEKASRSIPLSEFAERLEDKQIVWISLDEGEIRGQFARPQTMADGTAVRDFRTQLPSGMGADWEFVKWLLDKSGNTARVEVHSANNYVINILLPLIPWLLIFGFIWFFVFRNLRKTARQAQCVITGPGRWVPDEPGKAGQP